jgi:K+-sensing histidine kinase KdpD
VEEHTEKLKLHDLSGENTRTGIRELDEISAAIDDLKASLSDSLESKWRDEQKTKAEMAQIAHDLKTPLTIIRGNADLLLENADNDDDRESIACIIQSAESISRSILEILEK